MTKKALKRTPKNAPESIKKDNSVGNTENRLNRTKAIETLKSAKSAEAEKLKKGYKWVTDGKLHKLVAPSRIEHHLYNGFRVVNQ